jgi:TonB family protein
MNQAPSICAVVDSAAMLSSLPTRVFVGTLFTLLSVLVANPQNAPDLPPSTADPIQILANWVLKEAPTIGCNPGECKILVIDFFVPENINKAFGSQLADELSSKIVDPQKQIQLFSRNLLKAYMKVGDVDQTKLQSDRELGQFAHNMGASAIVSAKAVKVQGDTFRLLVRFLLAKDSNRVLTTEVMITRTPPPKALIEESAKALIKVGVTAPPPLPVDPRVREHPSCYYMPNPPYTKQARAANFQGAVLVDAVVQPEGSVRNMQILKSPGLGLDENILKTMKTWKCHPAKGEKGPLPTRVRFEINFRLY